MYRRLGGIGLARVITEMNYSPNRAESSFVSTRLAKVIFNAVDRDVQISVNLIKGELPFVVSIISGTAMIDKNSILLHLLMFRFFQCIVRLNLKKLRRECSCLHKLTIHS